MRYRRIVINEVIVMAESEKKLAAVYVSFATFKSAMDQLGQGMHSKIDRSVFVGFAWSIQNQLFAGMRFLGLINADSEPTETLEELVQGSEAEKKEKLKQVLEQRYAGLFALDLTKTTPHTLAAKLGELYDVSGDTRDKAVRFFLSAADYVGVPLSPLFKRGKNGGPSVPRRKRTQKPKLEGNGMGIPVTPPNPHGEHPGTAKSVKLKSGGTLTISATLDLFALDPVDRKFVFELIDQLEAYEKTSKAQL